MAASACGGGGHEAGSTGQLAPGPSSTDDEFAVAASGRCPDEWKEQYEAWSRLVAMPVYCATWMPGGLTGEIKPEYALRVPAKNGWQLGWAEVTAGNLVHVVFEGYKAGSFPPTCEGKPCFGGRAGTSQVGPFRVTWYLNNRASHTGHVAGVFRRGGDVYVVSMHVAAPSGTIAKTKANVAHMIRELRPVNAA